MTEKEATEQIQRVAKFRELEKRHGEVYAALESITSGGGENPFTGNWRESRQIKGLEVHCTKTRGGADAISFPLRDLGIEAHELGAFLREKLELELKRIKGMMDEI
jgi:hypothetical protein